MPQTKRQPYNNRFLKFIKLFALIGKDSRIFPKKCRACGKEYQSFPEYINATSPVEHCLEDYRETADTFGTMQYRNCACGSTLVINFAKHEYPLLDGFWEMIGKESKEEERPVREIVSEFREQCNRYITEQKDL
jgi:hypothetical protein